MLDGSQGPGQDILIPPSPGLEKEGKTAGLDFISSSHTAGPDVDILSSSNL